jgi:hypothetical protein
MACPLGQTGKGDAFLRKHADEPISQVGLLCQDRSLGLATHRDGPR